MPSNINISGYSDSYVYIDFGNDHDSKHPQNVTITNLKVQSIRSESEQKQNELKSASLNLFDIKFINDEPLEIEADHIQASFNSLQKVSKIEGEKTIKLRGLPSNSNNEDLNLTVSLHTDTFILESFNDNASIDFLSSKENDDFYSLIQFKSFKNSLITVSSENYDITMNYETHLSFYYDRSDTSSIKKLSDESAKVRIKIESENANVLFSDDKWPNTKILNDHRDDDFGSIEFDLSCYSNSTIQSSAHSIPLSINQCKNAHLIFNEQSAEISSLELTSGGQYLIENKKEGGEVIFNHHITFSPGAHLTIDEKVAKVRAHNVWSVFKTLPTQMTVNGHFEVDSCEFELLEYSVSFEYSPFPIDGKCSFVIPAKREVLMPIEIRKIEPNAKFNIRLSNDFLNAKYNDQIQSQFVSNCAKILWTCTLL